MSSITFSQNNPLIILFLFFLNSKAKDLIPIEEEIQKKLMKHFAGIWNLFLVNLFELDINLNNLV